MKTSNSAKAKDFDTKKTQDYSQAVLFLSTLLYCGARQDATKAKVHFRLIHDSNKKTAAITLEGTLKQHWNTLVSYNNRGYGVFIQINPNDDQGCKAANITAVRGLWIDCDHGLPESFLLEPTIVVQSSTPDKNTTIGYSLSQPTA